MIYDFPDTSAPIRQGDIFWGLPRLDISLDHMIVVTETGQRLAPWDDLAVAGESATIMVPVTPVWAIVATQDCDAVRSRDITLCEIRNFKTVEGKCKDTTSPNKWRNIIAQQARINLKWFYLPPDSTIGFSEKMAVDFLVTLSVPRADLEQRRSFRKGRLNSLADEHFRERISEFFRRYPYDEWYSFDQDELRAYAKDNPGITPMEWQKDFLSPSSSGQ